METTSWVNLGEPTLVCPLHSMMPDTILKDALAQLSPQWPLFLAWSLYAFIHSLTASVACKNFAHQHWPTLFASYRLAYNVLAGLLLIPIALIAYHQPGPVLWQWQGAAAWVINGITLLIFLSFLRHGAGYNLGEFLGLRPAVEKPTPQLVISDWHRHVRHPWYSLGLALIWSRDMNAAGLTSAGAMTLYFIIGSRYEEAKLVSEFGERYREYQKRVPALIPLPWKTLTRNDAERLKA